MSFKKVLRDIKTVKIQGAQNIALAAVHSLGYIFRDSKSESLRGIIKELNAARKEIIQTRPTEPCMRNTLNYVFQHMDKSDPVKLAKSIKRYIENVEKFFAESDERIVEYGAKKIRKGSVVCTHCHSSTVTKILIKAKKQGKNFEVHNMETRPLYQGRKTAIELAKVGIPVRHYVDSAARLALKKSDIFLIGADVITSEGKVINKIGSELMAEVAHKYDVPVYCCTNSWKFEPKSVKGYETIIEERNPKEVWEKPPKNVQIMNYAFEKVSPEMITGVISELGIYRPGLFVDQVKENYPWMFIS